MSDQKKPADTSPDESQSKELDEDQLDNVAGGASDPLPTESISFNYAKIEIKYLPATGGGDDSAQVPGGYPLKKK